MKTKKVERYRWAKSGDEGIQCLVKLGDLQFDLSYQREQISGLNVLSIARNFRWDAFGVIVVMRRVNNGGLFVVDGQHRVLAARRRGDIDHVPAIVFESDGRDHEAAAFIALNTARKGVPALNKFNARAEAGLQPDTDIRNWAKANGFRFGKHPEDNQHTIDFPTVLCGTWMNFGASVAMEALKVQDKIVGSGGMRSDIHKGLCWLEHNGIRCAEHVDRLRRKGVGRAEMVKMIRTLTLEMETKSERACGIAILRVINHGLKNRIKTPRIGDDE